MGLFLIAFMFSAANTNASTDVVQTEKVEVLIGHVFIKKEGYSENDNAQFVVDGYLPNSCYHLDETRVERDPDHPFLFSVHQYALRSIGQNCVLGIIPYSLPETLGKLAHGDYEMNFNIGSNPPLFATFEVGTSRSESNYPDVTSVTVTGTKAILLGLLPSLCSRIQKVQVHIEDDVVVVSPLLVSSPGPCPQIPHPFQASVFLGNLEDGRYLIQVGSAHGDLMKTFSVLRGDPE
jgi:hypothetical protein